MVTITPRMLTFLAKKILIWFRFENLVAKEEWRMFKIEP